MKSNNYLKKGKYVFYSFVATDCLFKDKRSVNNRGYLIRALLERSQREIKTKQNFGHCKDEKDFIISFTQWINKKWDRESFYPGRVIRFKPRKNFILFEYEFWPPEKEELVIVIGLIAYEMIN
jgi:hypothetical protein